MFSIVQLTGSVHELVNQDEQLDTVTGGSRRQL
jgi:hypothetical protein